MPLEAPPSLTRMRAPDWLLLSALSALFLTSLWLHVQAARSSTGLRTPLVLVDAAPDADGFPRLAPSLELAGQPPLPIGAQVLRVGSFDTRGMGELRFSAAALAAVEGDRIELWIDRGAGPERLERPVVAHPLTWWWYLPSSLAFGLLGVIGIFRVPDRRLARVSLAAALLYGAMYLRFYGPSIALNYVWMAAYGLEATLAIPLGVRVVTLFPTPISEGRLARFGPWLLALLGPAA